MPKTEGAFRKQLRDDCVQQDVLWVSNTPENNIGIPDCFIAKRGIIGTWTELKWITGNLKPGSVRGVTLSPAQKNWGRQLKDAGQQWVWMVGYQVGHNHWRARVGSIHVGRVSIASYFAVMERYAGELWPIERMLKAIEEHYEHNNQVPKGTCPPSV